MVLREEDTGLGLTGGDGGAEVVDAVLVDDRHAVDRGQGDVEAAGVEVTGLGQRLNGLSVTVRAAR